MTSEFVKSRFVVRIFDILIPILSWIVITLPIWLSPFHPAVASYFIIGFVLYFFYKSLKSVYYAVISYKMIIAKRNSTFISPLKKLVNSKNINHFIIIPNYKEPLHKLRSSIQTLAANHYPYKKLNLVLAFEDREEAAREKEKRLRKEFASYFKSIIATYHPLLPNEVAGKASNQTYAARVVDRLISDKNINPEDVLITICDADSHFSKNYFAYLTYIYLKDKGRHYHFYWAPILLYNNFWQLPFFVRMQATLSSVIRLAFLSDEENLIQISTYSTSLWLLKKIDFWDVDIIPEDWHVYFQAFFKFGEKVKTIPLYTIINGDAVYSGGVFKTLKNRYEQEKRWAWGVSDISYGLSKFFTTSHIKPWIKIKKILFVAETHLLWPTTFFILTLSAFIPPLISPVFKRTVLGFILPSVTSLILTLSSIMMLLYIYLDIKIRQRVKQKTALKNLPFLFIQWYLLPLVSFVLSSLPALEAHTRIIMGKKLEYKVTEKV